jgi:hypothetical protein
MQKVIGCAGHKMYLDLSVSPSLRNNEVGSIMRMRIMVIKYHEPT